MLTDSPPRKANRAEFLETPMIDMTQLKDPLVTDGNQPVVPSLPRKCHSPQQHSSLI